MKRTTTSAKAALMLAGAAAASSVRADSPYATELISQNAAYGSASLYNDPNAVLGEPTRIAQNLDPQIGTAQYHVNIVAPAYSRDLNINKVITTLSRKSNGIGGFTYGSITVKFDHDITDDPANPYGIDLNVFGNSSYTGSDFVSDATDMRTHSLTGGIVAEPVVISVSPDNVNWYTYSAGPYGDTAFPTQGNAWSPTQHDATGNGWTTQATDFTKPVNPTLDAILGAEGFNMPVYDAMKTYVNAGGGTGIDLAASGFSSIRYVRVNSTAQFRDGEIDAFADVRPMQVGEALSITPANVVDHTLLKFQSATDNSRTAVVADFSAVSDLAKLSTTPLANGEAIAALPANQPLLAGYSLGVSGLINESATISYAADLGLLPGLDYLGNGANLKLLGWSATGWKDLPFSFDQSAGLVQLTNWSGATGSFAVVALPVYWDINSAAPGAGGATPSGNWNGTTANFTLDPAGSLASTVGNPSGSNVYFTAGTDGTGSYTVTVSGTQSAGSVNIARGNVTFTGETIKTATFNVAADSAAIVFSTLAGGAASTLTKTGPGTLKLSSVNTHTGSTTVDGGTLVLGNADAIKASSGLTINTGAKAQIAPGLPKAVTLSTVTTTGTAQLDMATGSMVVKNSSLATIQAMVATAVGPDLTWDGPGIGTSAAAADPEGITAVGIASYADFSSGGFTEFQGITDLDADDVLVRTTYLGDSDLSGDTNLDDFPLFLFGLEDPAAPQTWYYGDYNYSGEVDLDDFPLFLAGLENDPIQSSTLADLIEMSSLSAGDKSAMLGVLSIVPEPATFALFSAAACGGLTLRRRNNA